TKQPKPFTASAADQARLLSSLFRSNSLSAIPFLLSHRIGVRTPIAAVFHSGYTRACPRIVRDDRHLR
ncbi:hypothetical protein, partial [Massilia timonae]|uniref:hypothetical protein n=1 Tax=Massilia timonae TaxID=47229 RepID=UPI0028A0C68F